MLARVADARGSQGRVCSLYTEENFAKGIDKQKT